VDSYTRTNAWLSSTSEIPSTSAIKNKVQFDNDFPSRTIRPIFYYSEANQEDNYQLINDTTILLNPEPSIPSYYNTDPNKNSKQIIRLLPEALIATQFSTRKKLSRTT
jgi:hypothetical protein